MEWNRDKPQTAIVFFFVQQAKLKGCFKKKKKKKNTEKTTIQLAFFINLQQAVIGPSATLTGR